MRWQAMLTYAEGILYGDALAAAFTINIAQLAPQVKSAERIFQSLGDTAQNAGDDVEKSMADAAAGTEKSLSKADAAEKKSAENTAKQEKFKWQTKEETNAEYYRYREYQSMDEAL